MEQTELTIRLQRNLLEGAKHYAHEHDTTLTRLVSEYLRQLGTDDELLSGALTVGRLTGALSPDASLDDYRQYFEEKHGAQA
jgi:hypothetical protein